MNRRKWLAAAGLAATGLAVGAVVISKRRGAPARVVWRRVRAEGFNVEAWQGHLGTTDWVKRRMYSLSVDRHGCVFHSLDLDRFTLETRRIDNGPHSDAASILHPASGKLWAIEGGDGEVFAMDLDTGQLTQLGGGPESRRRLMQSHTGTQSPAEWASLEGTAI